MVANDSVSSAVPYDCDMPMHPRPWADTTRPDRPSSRVCMLSILSSIEQRREPFGRHQPIALVHPVAEQIDARPVLTDGQADPAGLSEPVPGRRGAGDAHGVPMRFVQL